MTDGGVTGWRCGECDTWNTRDAQTCLVCEEPVREAWLPAPESTPGSTADAASPDAAGGDRASGPERSAGGRPGRVSIPLHPQTESAGPAQEPPAVGTPPSVPLLIARANNADRNRRPRPALIAIVVAVALVVVIAVVAFITLT